MTDLREQLQQTLGSSNMPARESRWLSVDSAKRDLYRASNIRPDGRRWACQTCEDPEIGLAFDRAEMPDSTILVLRTLCEHAGPVGLRREGILSRSPALV